MTSLMASCHFDEWAPHGFSKWDGITFICNSSLTYISYPLTIDSKTYYYLSGAVAILHWQQPIDTIESWVQRASLTLFSFEECTTSVELPQHLSSPQLLSFIQCQKHMLRQLLCLNHWSERRSHFSSSLSSRHTLLPQIIPSIVKMKYLLTFV